MKRILEFLTGKAGKMALSGLQAVGLSAAVGVAGIAAWQMLNSPAEVNPDTAFSSTDNDVVFVAGATGGSGYGANYGVGGNGFGEGGVVRSSIQTRMSNDMRLMQEDAIRLNLPAETATVSERQVNAVERYDMTGASEGLGINPSEALDRGGIPGAVRAGGGASGGAGGAGMSGFDVGALQEQIAQMQAAAQQQQQTAGAADGQALTADATASITAALQGRGSAGPGKWDMASGIARANGNNLDSTPLQPGGAEGESLNPGRRNAPEGAGANPDRLGGAGREPMFEGGREGTSVAGKNMHRGDALEAMAKQSAEVAGNSAKAANEGTKVFMSGNRLSGGIQLVGSEVSKAGGGGRSADFKGVGGSSLAGGIGAAIQEAIDPYAAEAAAYENARKKLRTKLALFVSAGAVLLATAMALRWIPLWGIIAVLAAYAVYMGSYFLMRKAISDFRKEWYDNDEKLVNYKQDGYANKADNIALASFGFAAMACFASIIMATIGFTVTIPALYLTNYGSTEAASTAADESGESGGDSDIHIATSPYGDNAPDDGLYLNED